MEQDDLITRTRKEIRKSIAEDRLEEVLMNILKEQATSKIQTTAFRFKTLVEMVLSGGQPMIS